MHEVIIQVAKRLVLDTLYWTKQNARYAYSQAEYYGFLEWLKEVRPEVIRPARAD